MLSTQAAEIKEGQKAEQRTLLSKKIDSLSQKMLAMGQKGSREGSGDSHYYDTRLILLRIQELEGCHGLLLMSSDNIQSIKKEILTKAKQLNTPILIKQQDKFFIYGDKNKQWNFTEIKETAKIPQDLLFDKTLSMLGNVLLPRDLIDTLKVGHAQLKDGEAVEDKRVSDLIALIDSFTDFLDQPSMANYLIFSNHHAPFSLRLTAIGRFAGALNDLVDELIKDNLYDKIRALNSKCSFECEDPSLNDVVASYEGWRGQPYPPPADGLMHAIALLKNAGAQGLPRRNPDIIIKLTEAMSAGINILEKPLDKHNLAALLDNIQGLPTVKAPELYADTKEASKPQPLYYARIALLYLAEKPTQDYLKQQFKSLHDSLRLTPYSNYYHHLTQNMSASTALLTPCRWEIMHEVYAARLLTCDLVDCICDAVRETNAINIKKLFAAANFDKKKYDLVSDYGSLIEGMAKEILNKHLDDNFSVLESLVSLPNKSNEAQFYKNALEKAKELRKGWNKDEIANREEILALAYSLQVVINTIQNRTADDLIALGTVALDASKKSSLWKQFGAALLILLGAITTPVLIGLPIFFKGREIYKHYDQLNTMSDFYTKLESDYKPLDKKEAKRQERGAEADSKLSSTQRLSG